LCIARKSEIKAVITTGCDKFYSNGLDLEWLAIIATNVPDYIDTFFQKWHKLQERILTFPLLTIAAINGKFYT